MGKIRWQSSAISYADYAQWQQGYLASPLARTHREFWQSRLQDLPQLRLPATGSRSENLSRPGGRADFRLAPLQARQWLASIPARGRYAALAAATLALLHLESGQSDLVLGLPVAHRDRPELQEQVGLHINMLPLRRQIDSDSRLQDLHTQCAEGIVEAMAHADYPFARLVDDLGLCALRGRHPVFDAMLIFHQQPVPALRLEGLTLAPFDPQSYASRFDLDVEVWAGEDGVHGFIEYDAGLFSQDQARGFADRWKLLLLAGAAAPATPLSRLRSPATESPDAAGFLAGALAVDEEF